MTDPTGGLLSAALKAGGSLFRPLTDRLFRKGRMADTELSNFRGEIQRLSEKINSSSVDAQMAVRASPNDPDAITSHQSAVRLSTEVGAEFASLFDVDAIAHGLPPNLIQARRRYREVVTDENNRDFVDPSERELQCAAIESACAEFHRVIRDYALKNWGIGIGAKSGRRSGRNFPK